jgi:hypothetical protein
MRDSSLKKQLEKARNIHSVLDIAKACAVIPEEFDKLVSLMEDKDRHISAMAAWSMGHAVQQQPDILARHHHEVFIRIAAHTTLGGIKRNILRAWQWAPPAGELLYEAADIALKLLADPKEDVAVKAFSITLLQNALKEIPELKDESLFVIEKNLPQAKPAFTSRAKKFMAFARHIH